MDKNARGKFGEEAAAEYLVHKGYKIKDMHYRAGRLGEIDIIAERDEYTCFIEVKTRSSGMYGTPSEAVNPSKQKRIARVSLAYLNYKKINNANIRFDVVEVYISTEGNVIKVRDIKHIENAFS
jgi:putative endonuclease